MNQCEVCGNKYENCLKIVVDDEVHLFDSFECAIHALAPTCQHCGCRILGHGIEAEGGVYCCAHCSRSVGLEGARDNLTYATA
ncbi:MAG: hypothetical protein WD342_02800 [Verrucomicrobiales bacterium]